MWAGVQVTVIVQFPPGGTPELQVLVCLKSVAFVPVTAIVLTANLRPLVLVSVTVWAPLLVPTTWLAKLRLVWESETVGICNTLETP
jgi:hypothetical protein